ncbi:MAG: DNA primase [Ruminococcaceae bacterium]|nr:DNA primase [Oscillospiraceae bacterium]
MIPRAAIEEILYRADIVDVISSYVTLKRAGSNFGGLCPFHSEKTPSFTVFPATKSFYCFGCGAGGDVITFIMKTENLDYPSAIEFLAQRVGITIEHDDRASKDLINRKRVYEMNLEAAKFFRSCLFDPKIGEEGMTYLKSRGMSGATIKRFGLGYAPRDFGMLTDHMRRKGFSEEELITAFLCGKSQKTGRAYDYFRGRVMFPIIDTTGNVIAFGGRVLDDSKPKYLNSSDTPGFKKSRNLFALNYAKDDCAEEIILCEGYMDVIALHAAGFSNAVATLGTAITSEQARIMAKYTKKVIISYDSDEAGQRAANRAMQLLGEVGLEVRILKMNGAKDPDEFIKKFGADRFRHILKQSKTGFEYKLEGVLSRYDISVPADKIKASGELCSIISEVYSAVEREVYIARVAECLLLSPDGIKNDVERLRGKKMREQKKLESREAMNSAKNYGDRVNIDSVKNVAANAAEEAILGLLLTYEEHRAAVANGKVELSTDDFFTSLGKRMFDAIMELQVSDSGFEFSLLGETFTPDEIGRMTKYRLERGQLTRNGIDVLLTSVDKLKKEKLHEQEKHGEDKFAALRRKRQSAVEQKNKNL